MLRISTSKTHDDYLANLTFASVYPHYLTKIEKTGITKAELHQVITWPTGFEKNPAPIDCRKCYL
ncbi:DUF2200 family protein [Salinimicrobium flavum]|uniref:DUF2200 family protein n=1 Tax=Salinimicrobium flavum TaxID=1737065 RepID=A0ABW5IZD4_9FLAO